MTAEDIEIIYEEFVTVYDPWIAQDIAYFRLASHADMFVEVYRAWKAKHGKYAQ